MNKPVVVIDSEKVRITDLGNGNSEFWNKTDNTKEIYGNAEIYAALLAMEAKETPIYRIAAYKHKNH